MRTTDLDRARDEIARAFCPHRLELLDPSRGLDAVYNSAPVGSASCSFLRYGGPVRVRPGRLETFFLVNIPLRGAAEFRIGSTLVAAAGTRGAVLSPDDVIDMQWADRTEMLIVQFERASLERRLADLLGAPPRAPLRFAPGLDGMTGRLRGWLRIVHLIRAELERREGLAGSAPVTLQLEELAMTALLHAQPSNYSALLGLEPVAASSRAVRRAVDFMHANASQPLTGGAVARAAGVGSRALQAAFRRDLGTTPTAYLRDLRLELAHAELTANGDDATVTEIALRCGFAHPGRFAAAYRARFGIPPSAERRR
ncbi:MAG TPA: AraC family transcriptional regulator [Gaiellaceae bacterium]|nr:AraC family transcriptional regulator [Gaiellaceae bacterium]